MDQPLNFWGVVIACPGCEKTPVCKHMSKNLEQFKCSCQRNHGSCTLDDVMWGGGTPEAWKKTLADAPLTSVCSLVVSNEFHSFASDSGRHSGQKDESMLCDMFDGMSIRRHAKIDGDISTSETNVGTLGFIQPDYFEPLIRRGNDPSGLFRRFVIAAPAVDFKKFKDIERLPHVVQFKPCKVAPFFSD